MDTPPSFCSNGFACRPIALAICGVLVALASLERLRAAPGDVLGAFSTGAAVFASPTLGRDGTLYIGSNDSKCYALSAQSGLLQEKWTFAADDWIDASVAVGSDDTLYVATYNSTLLALDPRQGSELWSVSVGDDVGGFGIIQSSPAVAGDGTLVLTTNAGFAHAFSSAGDPLWSFEIGAASQSSPVIDSQGRVVFGADDGKLYCLNLAGELQWAFAVDDAGSDESRIYGSPALDDQGNVYIGSGNGHLYSVDAAGQLRWKFATPEAVDTTPAIDQSHQVYFASRNGSLYCVDHDGQLQWSSYLGDIFYSSPVIDADGFVYATYFGGQGKTYVVAFAPGGIELWQTQIDAVVDSSVTISTDGVLFLGAFDGNVYAIEGQGAALDFESPWPRFRKDTRSRGRVIDGTLSEIVSQPRANVVLDGSSAEFALSATSLNDAFFWRKNEAVIVSQNGGSSHVIGSVSKADVGVYDVIVSNDFGEVLSRPTYLAVYSVPTYELDLGMARFAAQFAYPDGDAMGEVVIEKSTDLETWSPDGVSLEVLSSGQGAVEVAASFTTAAALGFLRLEGQPKP